MTLQIMTQSQAIMMWGMLFAYIMSAFGYGWQALIFMQVIIFGGLNESQFLVLMFANGVLLMFAGLYRGAR